MDNEDEQQKPVNPLRNPRPRQPEDDPMPGAGVACSHAPVGDDELAKGLLADFYAPSEARQWIFAPQKLLGGTSPAELIRAGRIDEVMRLVNQLREAVHF